MDKHDYFKYIKDSFKKLDEYRKFLKAREKDSKMRRNNGINDLNRVVKELNKNIKNRANCRFSLEENITRTETERESSFTFFVEGKNGKEQLSTVSGSHYPKEEYLFTFSHRYAGNCRNINQIREAFKEILSYENTAEKIEKVQ